MPKLPQQKSKEKGKNQTVARDDNLAMILHAFLKAPMSRVDISRIFNLSKPIAAELEAANLIRADIDGNEDYLNIPGVKPQKYELNTDYGLIAIIDMSTVEVHIQVCDFSGSVLSETNVADKELILYDDIVYFCDILDGLLKKFTESDKKLLSLCVALPCAYNKKTGKIDWSPRFDIENDFNLFNFLSSRYDTEIILNNDAHFMLFGEMHKGLLSGHNTDYALYIYIDAGIGGSLFLNGRLEKGEEGKAGDVGFLPYLNKNGEYRYFDSVASINAIKKELKRELANNAKSPLASLKKLHFADIRAAYFDGDPLTVKIVEQTAVETAEALTSLLEILNINFVIISGRITQLGENYRSIIEKTLKPRFPSIRVKYSNLGNTAIHEGAIFAAYNKLITKVISNRKSKSLI